MKSDETFQTGEAEQQVVSLREYLRAAAVLRQNGDSIAARQQETRANVILEELLTRLAPRFEMYAWKAFSDRPRAVQEDAVREMIYQVCRSMKNLSDKPGAHYFETYFNAAVKSCLHDAIRKILREEETDDEGRRPLSLDAATEESEGRETFLDHTPDDRATQAMENVIGAAAAAQLMQQLPSSRHALVFQSRLLGNRWDEVATQAGISDKTARKYFHEAELHLRDLLTQMQ